MGMTQQESATRTQIADHLGKQGHQTYAEYLMLFDLHFMSDKEAERGSIAYMIPNKGMIFINRDITDIDVIDFLLRHEMLHEYLKHGDRYKKIMRQKYNLKDDEEPTFENPLEARAWHELHNRAADWEISKYYSHKKDFPLAKNIPYKDTFVAGLVLELDHPEWLKLTYEEIFEKLEEQLEQIKKELEKQQASSSMERRSVEQQAEDMEEQAAEIGQEAAEMEKQLSQKAGSGENEVKSKKQKAEESELEKKIKELKQKAKQLKNQAEELKKDFENRSAAFTDPSAAAEREERLDKIKKFWDTLENETKLAKELESQLYDDKREQSVKQKQQADREYAKKLSNAITLAPMKQFVLDLNNTLKKQISSKNTSIRSFTKKPRSTLPGVYRAGEKITPIRKKNKPTIQVIYDRSGSWSPPQKTAAGDAALSTIKKKYVDKGLINLEVFYCSSGPVTNNRAKADAGGGGMDGVAVIDHLIETKPDNVIIMTDSDPDYFKYDKFCRLSGAVWFLFYDNEVAPVFASHIIAKSKKYYDLTNIEGLTEIIKDPDNN